VRTFAPVGETPVLREQVTREHLSAISGITPEGKLLVKTQDHSFNGTEAASFLKHLVKLLSERLLVVWDSNPIHGSNEVRRFLTSKEGKGVWLVRLPGYAPDLNPDEGIWNYLKRVELKNVVCRDLGELFTEYRKAAQRLRQKLRIIRACFAEVGLV
jgi:transposase